MLRSLLPLLALAALWGAVQPQYFSNVCYDLHLRTEELTSTIKEFFQLIDTQVSFYEDVFTQLPKTQQTVCQLKRALQEVKRLLQLGLSRGTRDPEGNRLWIRRLDAAQGLYGGFCDVALTHRTDLTHFVSSVTAFKQEVQSTKRSILGLNLDSCDQEVYAVVDQYQGRLAGFRGQWEAFMKHVTSLALGGLDRGRSMDNSTFGGHVIAFNHVVMPITSSSISNTKFDLFTVKTS